MAAAPGSVYLRTMEVFPTQDSPAITTLTSSAGFPAAAPCPSTAMARPGRAGPRPQLGGHPAATGAGAGVPPPAEAVSGWGPSRAARRAGRGGEVGLGPSCLWSSTPPDFAPGLPQCPSAGFRGRPLVWCLHREAGVWSRTVLKLLPIPHSLTNAGLQALP